MLLLLTACLFAPGPDFLADLGREELSFANASDTAGVAFQLELFPPDAAEANLNYDLKLRNRGEHACDYARYELPAAPSNASPPALGADWEGQAPVSVDRLLPAGHLTPELDEWGSPEPGPDGAIALVLALALCEGATVEGDLTVLGDLFVDRQRGEPFDSASTHFSVRRLW